MQYCYKNKYSSVAVTVKFYTLVSHYCNLQWQITLRYWLHYYNQIFFNNKAWTNAFQFQCSVNILVHSGRRQSANYALKSIILVMVNIWCIWDQTDHLCSKQCSIYWRKKWTRSSIAAMSRDNVSGKKLSELKKDGDNCIE